MACLGLAAGGLAAGAAAAQQVTGNAFNPAISLILDGKFTSFDNEPEDYAISGFLLGEEAGLSNEGLSLDESELVISSNVDDRFYGSFTAALATDADGETEVEIEEAYLQTLALPEGFTLKAGRFFSDIGYLNVQHAHRWEFADEPLVYRALLGTQYGDTGVQLKWLPPTERYIELGAEVMRGSSFPAGGAANDGVGAFSVFAHTGGDVGASHSWRGGVSYLSTKSEGRESPFGELGDASFTGDSDVAIADFVWKWAENGNPRARNFVVQGEYLFRREDGNLLTQEPGPGFISFAQVLVPYDGEQQGFYLQGVYQWRPRWRAGLRYDRISADNDLPVLETVPGFFFDFNEPLGDADHDPNRITAMVDWSHSEFSRLRLQLAKDRSTDDGDTQFVLQYIMSLGAHGAHSF
ncbi:MAG: hypothetical protein H0W33_05500 [Gammaproteobacteria bacterium]|nr:hypothetical protein [Gammaproteobacteria bacterium]